jgi:hypothetical protein
MTHPVWFETLSSHFHLKGFSLLCYPNVQIFQEDLLLQMLNFPPRKDVLLSQMIVM